MVDLSRVPVDAIHHLGSAGRVRGSEIWRAFGTAVRARQGELGLSPKEPGCGEGLHRTYVSGVGRGERNPTLIVIEKLAVALETGPKDLL